MFFIGDVRRALKRTRSSGGKPSKEAPLQPSTRLITARVVRVEHWTPRISDPESLIDIHPGLERFRKRQIGE